MDDALEVVSFKAGAFRFAVEARQIEGMLSEMPAAAVTVESLLGLPLAEGAQRRCLRVGVGFCVEVSEPLALRRLPSESLYPLPELVATRIQIKVVKALALEADGVTLLIDLRALLAQGVEADDFRA